MFTLTIYFIALNEYVEFVLIYRPHPVNITVATFKNNKFSLQYYICWRGMFTSNVHCIPVQDLYSVQCTVLLSSPCCCEKCAFSWILSS
jgi:hypothetical protein